jgi:hypothetical protein
LVFLAQAAARADGDYVRVAEDRFLKCEDPRHGFSRDCDFDDNGSIIALSISSSYGAQTKLRE